MYLCSSWIFHHFLQAFEATPASHATYQKFSEEFAELKQTHTACEEKISVLREQVFLDEREENLASMNLMFLLLNYKNQKTIFWRRLKRSLHMLWWGLESKPCSSSIEVSGEFRMLMKLWRSSMRHILKMLSVSMVVMLGKKVPLFLRKMPMTVETLRRCDSFYFL